MPNKAYIGLLISIISVSFAAILIVSCDAPPMSIAFYRLLFTTVIILPFVIINKKIRTELINLPRRTLFIMTGVGAILAIHFSLWISSLELTSVASSVILVTAHPLLVGPVSHFFLRERLSRINTIGICLSVTGVILLVYGNYGFSTGLDTLHGNILAILGGIAAGFYILAGRTIRKTVSIGSYAFVIYSTGTIMLFLICLFYGATLINISTRDYGIILLMAIVAGIFGHTLYNWSLEYVKASIASVALLGEPIGSSLLAFTLPWINQTPSHYTLIGGGIILFGIFLTAREINHKNKTKILKKSVKLTKKHD
jgi:drug/metabolite transporter (DMT)-like permease